MGYMKFGILPPIMADHAENYMDNFFCAVNVRTLAWLMNAHKAILADARVMQHIKYQAQKPGYNVTIISSSVSFHLP